MSVKEVKELSSRLQEATGTKEKEDELTRAYSTLQELLISKKTYPLIRPKEDLKAAVVCYRQQGLSPCTR